MTAPPTDATASPGVDPDPGPRRVLLGVVGGLVVGSVVVIVAISFAALVFSGRLAGLTGTGVGLALAGAAVVAVTVALASSFRGMVATPQDSTAAVVALITASVAASLPADATESELLLTAVAAVAVTTILTGAGFFALGWFRLGGLVRYLPYPVIGGFLAGTGWLLVRGSLGVMADVPVTLASAGALFAEPILVRWLPGTLFAIALLVVMRRVSHFIVLPAMLVGSIALFYLVLLATGTTVAQAQAMGLLLGPFPASDLWQPLTLDALAGARWDVVLPELGSVAPVLVVGMVALLLNATGLELAIRRDVDLDRELRTAGVANVIAGAVGGLPGFQTLSLSALGHRVAPDSRLVGLTSGALCLLTLFTGDAVLSLVPKASVGGLLLFLGLVFLTEWVVDARHTLPRVDYVVVLVILVLIGAVGFLESVGAGIVIAVVLFVVNYSRVDVVRFALDGASHHSNVDRPREQLEVLEDSGGSLLILRLQGYLFFGTANGLLERLRGRLDDLDEPSLDWVVIDFRLVSGIDSSAVLSFVKLGQLAAARGFGVVVTDLPPLVAEQLRQGGFLGEGSEVKELDELDRGVEWCEDRLLAAAGVPLEAAPMPLRERLDRAFRGAVDLDELLEFFEPVEVAAGELVMRQGDPPDDGLYVVESGKVSVELELEEGHRVRLLTMGPGSIVGELELYLGTPRTASVVADEASVLWRVSAESLLLLQQVDPPLAARFHQVVCQLLAERLAKNNQTLRALLA